MTLPSYNYSQASTLDELNLSLLKKQLDEDHYTCIRGLINEQEVQDALNKLKSKFDRHLDHPTRGESPSAVRTNFQKLLLGETSQSGGQAARFFRTIYNPMWEEDIYGLKDIFMIMTKIRNRLIDRPDHFATDKIEDNGLFTASRIHQYPLGGGFFSAHKDFVITEVSDEAEEKEFYHVIVNLSKKGVDFETGGGYVESHGQRIDLDSISEPGDILIYNRNSIHGVEDIDPHKLLDLDHFCGRVTAFVSLYNVR